MPPTFDRTLRVGFVDQDQVDVAEVEVEERLLHRLDDLLPVQRARLATAVEFCHHNYHHIIIIIIIISVIKHQTLTVKSGFKIAQTNLKTNVQPNLIICVTVFRQPC